MIRLKPSKIYTRAISRTVKYTADERRRNLELLLLSGYVRPGYNIDRNRAGLEYQLAYHHNILNELQIDKRKSAREQRFLAAERTYQKKHSEKWIVALTAAIMVL